MAMNSRRAPDGEAVAILGPVVVSFAVRSPTSPSKTLENKSALSPVRRPPDCSVLTDYSETHRELGSLCDSRHLDTNMRRHGDRAAFASR